MSCCSPPPTVSRYFPKWEGWRVLFPFWETCHWILKCTLHCQFPFLEMWPWKSISKYLNEISTKHCHTTTFMKPLTKATQLIWCSLWCRNGGIGLGLCTSSAWLGKAASFLHPRHTPLLASLLTACSMLPSCYYLHFFTHPPLPDSKNWVMMSFQSHASPIPHSAPPSHCSHSRSWFTVICEAQPTCPHSSPPPNCGLWLEVCCASPSDSHIAHTT